MWSAFGVLLWLCVYVLLHGFMFQRNLSIVAGTPRGDLLLGPSWTALRRQCRTQCICLHLERNPKCRNPPPFFFSSSLSLSLSLSFPYCTFSPSSFTSSFFLILWIINYPVYQGHSGILWLPLVVHWKDSKTQPIPTLTVFRLLGDSDNTGKEWHSLRIRGSSPPSCTGSRRLGSPTCGRRMVWIFYQSGSFRSSSVLIFVSLMYHYYYLEKMFTNG